MKNIFVFWNAALTLGVVVLFALLNNVQSSNEEPIKPVKTTVKKDEGNSSAKPSASPITVVENETGVGIAFVNTDTLLDNYKYFKKMRSNLEAKGKRVEQDLMTRKQALETEFGQAQQKAQSGAMSREQMATTEQQLMAKQQQFMQYSQSQEMKLAEEEKQLSENLNKALRGYLSTYAKANGLQFILGYSNAGGILYADSSKDITRVVLTELNAKYK